MPGITLARFDLDATPPLGHPLCGGWITPATQIQDPLRLRGIVLLADGPPIVIAAVDWTGILNKSHQQWCETIAAAAHTIPQNVALHTVHQHDAPFIDQGANAHLKRLGATSQIHDESWQSALRDQASLAIRRAMANAQPVTHFAVAKAKVDQVASNRRVLGPDGKVKFVRYSACTDPEIRAAPEGTIDPSLAAISFWNDMLCLARIHSYATHPMSHYGKGNVSADFVGIARDARDRDEPGTLHIYLTGCAGNITAGKYNDGDPANRAVLANRIHQAMAAADHQADQSRNALKTIDWNTQPVAFKPREDLDRQSLEQSVQNPNTPLATRHREAFVLSWLDQLQNGPPILLGRLKLDDGSALFLPGETFVEYQLNAQSLAPNRPLLVAAYGNDGPWYIPLEKSFDQGGYEPGVAFASRKTETDYRAAIAKVLHST